MVAVADVFFSLFALISEKNHVKGRLLGTIFLTVFSLNLDFGALFC